MSRESEINQVAIGLVRRVMAERAWRPAKLGQEMDISAEIIRRWLRNERYIQVEHLVRLAEVGDLSLDEAFGLAGWSQDAGSQNVREAIREELGRVAQAVASALSGDSSAQPAAAPARGSRSSAPEPADTGELGDTARRALDRLRSTAYSRNWRSGGRK